MAVSRHKGYTPVMTEKYKITLIVKGNHSPTTEIRVLWE